jgi:Uma2 family endonuclease
MHAALRGTGCSVFVDGVQVEGENFSFIPDVVVTCGPEDYATPRVDEPMIVVEVLSPSSEKDDLGRKQAFYFGIPSLRHYLVVHQDRRLIVHHERRDDLSGKFLATIAPPDPIRLDPPGISLAFDDVYEDIPLGAPPLTAP